MNRGSFFAEVFLGPVNEKPLARFQNRGRQTGEANVGIPLSQILTNAVSLVFCAKVNSPLRIGSHRVRVAAGYWALNERKQSSYNTLSLIGPHSLIRRYLQAAPFVW
jgi:hypothetical protein